EANPFIFQEAILLNLGSSLFCLGCLGLSVYGTHTAILHCPGNALLLKSDPIAIARRALALGSFSSSARRKLSFKGSANSGFTLKVILGGEFLFTTLCTSVIQDDHFLSIQPSQTL